MINGIFAPSKITKYQIMKVLYFTATGNCLYVAKQLGGELLSIPQLMKSGTFGIEDENCIGCGTCAKVCPSDNIEIRDKRPVFLNRCEGCFGCLHNCPKVAIHLKNEQSTVRFRNSEVKISEIIAANK